MGLENYKLYLYRFRRPLFILGMALLAFIGYKIYTGFFLNTPTANEQITEIDGITSRAQIVTTPQLNFLKEQGHYSLIFDDFGKTYRLVEDSRQDKTISTFPKAIQNPLILGDDNFLIVQSGTATYLVNKRQSKNTLLNAFLKNPELLSISPKGHYVLYTIGGSDSYFLHNLKTNEPLEFSKKQYITSWNDDETLSLIDFRAVDDLTAEILSEQKSYQTTFLKYDPENKLLTTLFITDQFQQQPENLHSIGNGETLYFEVDGTAYRLITE